MYVQIYVLFVNKHAVPLLMQNPGDATVSNPAVALIIDHVIAGYPTAVNFTTYLYSTVPSRC